MKGLSPMPVTRVRKARAAGAAPTAGLVTVALAFAGLMASMAQTAMIPLVPLMPRLLDTSPSGVAWTVTAALVAGAVSNPIGRPDEIIMAVAAGPACGPGGPTSSCDCQPTNLTSNVLVLRHEIAVLR